MIFKRCARADPEGGPHRRRPDRGITLVETTLAVLMAVALLGGLSGVLSNTLAVREAAGERNERMEELRFAIERMESAVQTTDRLLLPRTDDPGTVQDESVRDPGVLAISLAATIDRDFNGIADADNDGDGLVDEDPNKDENKDFAPGIVGVDDDADGLVDEGSVEDDDEDGLVNEDPRDGLDTDGDGERGEDQHGDANGDNAPGVIGVDDDGDSLIDEGNNPDDDEDGSLNEDWVDTVVFRLVGTELIERIPVPWDVNGFGGVDGLDFVERVIAEGVQTFRVQRVAQPVGFAPVVEIQLDLATSGESVLSVKLLVRLGEAT